MTHERDVSICISSPESKHRGRVIVGSAVESFGISSPGGLAHLALVFQQMREPLWLFRRRVAGQDHVTSGLLPLIRTYLQFLFEGLDYLHTDCHIIHTGTLGNSVSIDFHD